MNTVWLKPCRAVVLVALGLVAAAPLRAQEVRPLWEAGAGLGAATVPAYKGSSVYRSYAMPLPYFIYRGEQFKADREGLRAGFWRHGPLSANLSLSGSLPVRSDGTLRQGMDNIAPNVELGGELKATLFECQSRCDDLRWTLHLPLRRAVAVERSGLHGVGWTWSPTLRHSQRLRVGGESLQWGSSLAVNFADRAYNGHYYDVQNKDVQPNRPAFASAGGYAGSTWLTGLSQRRGNWIFSGFVGVSSLSGAVFAASPLMERRSNGYAGLAVIYLLDKSAQTVRLQETETVQ